MPEYSHLDNKSLLSLFEEKDELTDEALVQLKKELIKRNLLHSDSQQAPANKTLVAQNLQQAFRFNGDELSLNKTGKASSDQKKFIRQKSTIRSGISLAIGWFITIVLYNLGNLLMPQGRELSPQSSPIAVAFVTLCAAILFTIAMIIRLLQIYRCKIISKTGRARIETSNGIFGTRYSLKISGATYFADETTQKYFDPNLQYQFYIAKGTNVIVSAELAK